MKLSEKIVMCRKQAFLSQDALAELVGVSRQAVSKWETGDALPETSKLPLLAEIFDVSIDWLLSDSDEPYQKQPPQQAQPPQKQAPEHLETLPGFLGRIFRRYGWLGGIYLLLGGLGITGIGILSRVLTREVYAFDPFGTGQIAEMPQMTTPMDTMSTVIIVIGVVVAIVGVITAIALRRWGKKHK